MRESQSVSCLLSANTGTFELQVHEASLISSGGGRLQIRGPAFEEAGTHAHIHMHTQTHTHTHTHTHTA